MLAGPSRLPWTARPSGAGLTRVPRRHYASQLPQSPLVFSYKPPPAPPHSSSPPPPPTSSSRTNSPPSSTSPGALPPSTLPKPRLDYARLLADPDHTTRNALQRKAPLKTHHLAHLSRLREMQLLLGQKLASIRAKQKDVSALIKSRVGDTDEALRQAKKLKVRAGEYEAHLSATEGELLDLALALPNFSHEQSPIGPEDNARVIETIGPMPDTGELEVDERRDHLRICQAFGWLDTDASAVATGASWPYLVGPLALLEQALVQYALSVAIAHGFTPVAPPDVVKTDLGWRCGFQPRDTQTEGGAPSQTYTLETDPNSPGLCLAGTAEIPLAGLFANRIIPSGELPKKVVGVGRAFRAEAGARGADTRGLYRVHQFTKVELFGVSDQEGGEALMGQIAEVQREIVRGLGLPTRVLEMPTEELGASASRKWDMESWMPGRGKWGEITSTSNCTDFQSRRLHIRYRPSGPPGSDGLPFAHTLNGTAAAIPRLIIALIENGARISPDGEVQGVVLPSVLRRFWLGSEQVDKGRILWE